MYFPLMRSHFLNVSRPTIRFQTQNALGRQIEFPLKIQYRVRNNEGLDIASLLFGWALPVRPVKPSELATFGDVVEDLTVAVSALRHENTEDVKVL
jgi:hypothetical protein